ncbi:hypothetical protein Pelo_575 [Pelomyxa schiedti]|nr:hypothetical protein Pelo_575 [Pelomyxa schiedti]
MLPTLSQQMTSSTMTGSIALSLPPPPTPSDHEHIVVVGTTGHVICFVQQAQRTSSKLKLLWDRNLDLPNDRPLLTPSVLLVSSEMPPTRLRVFAAVDYCLFALDAGTGAVEWISTITSIPIFMGVTALTGFEAVLCDAGDSVVASANCSVARINKATGAVLWRTPLPLAPNLPALPAHPSLSVGTRPSLVWVGVWGIIYAINLEHGCVVSRCVVNATPTFNVCVAQGDAWPMSIFAGVAGFVNFVDVTTLGLVKSKEVNLVGTFFNGVSVAYHNSRLYCATNGSLFCLDVAERKVLWYNELRGCGYQGSSLSIAVVADGPTSTPYAIVVGIRGRVVAVSPRGTTLWQCQMPKATGDFPSLLYDSVSGCLYAGQSGNVHLLDWHSGTIITNSALPHSGRVSVATESTYMTTQQFISH